LAGGEACHLRLSAPGIGDLVDECLDVHRVPAQVQVPILLCCADLHRAENLAAARVTLEPDQVAAVTALEPEDG
jgi:hypothetical protein